MQLIDSLVEDGWLKTPRIIEAFRKVKRRDFLPEEIKDLAELNEALSIGYGQTISQPLVVAFMLEQLQPQPGEKILDVGAGSGWTTALLAEIVGDKGEVVAVEFIPELKEFGQKNAKRKNVRFVCADGSKGFKDESPFDKVLASAAIQGEVPLAWKEQLKVNGRIVAPIGSSIWLFVKKAENEFSSTEYPGFAFVPLIET